MTTKRSARRAKKAQYKNLNMRWNDINLRVRFQREFLTGAHAAGHLEIWSVKPEREPLPISDTGYRSHFIDPAGVDELGGPVAYGLAWLEQEARSPKWRTAEFARRQLSLFD